jgi:hypothetical protein
MGEVHVYCRFNKYNDVEIPQKFTNVNSNGAFGIIKFLFGFKNVYKNTSPDLIVFDNRLSTLVYFFYSKLINKSKMIYDARELYILKDAKTIKSKIGCWFESKLIRNANLNISANSFRSDYMYNYYQLGFKPIVFENIRKLSFDSSIDYGPLYKNIFQTDKTNIITSNGSSFDRLTNRLVYEIVDKLENINLIITGKIDVNEEKELMRYASFNKSFKINFVGLVSANDLAYLISKSDIGVVSYNQDTLNNKYCASGKLYEFLFYKVPVVVTTNPPLKEICDNHGVGESNEDFSLSIRKIQKNYKYYIKNIDLFLKNMNIEKMHDFIRDEVEENLYENRNKKKNT